MVSFRRKRKTQCTVYVLTVVFALISGACFSAESCSKEYPCYSFNGYGTVGVAHSSESYGDFVLDNTQKEGAGYSQSWSPHIDSRIGAQFTAEFTPRLSGVLHVISQQQHDGTYQPQVDWANLKYRISPEYEIRVGRVVMPTFLVSEYRKVGYALPWVRTPTELYSSLPNDDFDGAQFVFNKHFGKVRNSFTISLGKSYARLRGNVKLNGNRAWGFTDILEYGDLTLRASHFMGTLKLGNR